MSTKMIIACATIAAALGGCAAHLEQSATKELEAQCAAMGMQFVKTQADQMEAVVVSRATVGGVCVDPSDPRYEAPASSTEN